MRTGQDFAKNLGFGLVVAVTLVLGAGFTKPASAQVFRVAQVLEFELLKGNPSWYQSSLQRLYGSVWGFFQGNVFGHDEPDTRRDLFPLWGRFSVSGNQVTFQARQFATVSTAGTAYAFVMGDVQAVNGRLVLTAFVATGATYGAIVNEQQFLNSASKLIRTRVVLERVQ